MNEDQSGTLEEANITHRFQQFVHEVEAQMAVLKEDPTALCLTQVEEAPRVHLLALTHRNRAAFYRLRNLADLNSETNYTQPSHYF